MQLSARGKDMLLNHALPAGLCFHATPHELAQADSRQAGVPFRGKVMVPTRQFYGLSHMCDLTHNFAVWQAYELFPAFVESDVNDSRSAWLRQSADPANSRRRCSRS